MSANRAQLLLCVADETRGKSAPEEWGPWVPSMNPVGVLTTHSQRDWFPGVFAPTYLSSEVPVPHPVGTRMGKASSPPINELKWHLVLLRGTLKRWVLHVSVNVHFPPR